MEHVPSQKKCEKKLKEIQALQTKAYLTKEEVEKLKSQSYYANILKTVHRKFLHVIPDDVQIHILSFIEHSERLRYLRATYTPKFITDKLNSLPKTEGTNKKLFSCIKYIKHLLNKYLNKDGDIYRSIRYYITDNKYHSVSFKDFKKNWRAFELLREIVLAGIKNYTKIYTEKTSINELKLYEKNILKLYLYILTI